MPESKPALFQDGQTYPAAQLQRMNCSLIGNACGPCHESDFSYTPPSDTSSRDVKVAHGQAWIRKGTYGLPGNEGIYYVDAPQPQTVVVPDPASAGNHRFDLLQIAVEDTDTGSEDIGWTFTWKQGEEKPLADTSIVVPTVDNNAMPVLYVDNRSDGTLAEEDFTDCRFGYQANSIVTATGPSGIGAPPDAQYYPLGSIYTDTSGIQWVHTGTEWTPSGTTMLLAQYTYSGTSASPSLTPSKVTQRGNAFKVSGKNLLCVIPGRYLFELAGNVNMGDTQASNVGLRVSVNTTKVIEIYESTDPHGTAHYSMYSQVLVNLAAGQAISITGLKGSNTSWKDTNGTSLKISVF